MTLDVFDLDGVPLYNADVEAEGNPERVAALDAAIDWMTERLASPQDAPLRAKPVGIIGASSGLIGSARGQSQLRQAFEFTNSFCMPQPEILVAPAHEKFDAEGRLTDETKSGCTLSLCHGERSAAISSVVLVPSRLPRRFAPRNDNYASDLVLSVPGPGDEVLLDDAGAGVPLPTTPHAGGS